MFRDIFYPMLRKRWWSCLLISSLKNVTFSHLSTEISKNWCNYIRESEKLWWITWNIQKKYKDGFIRIRQVKLCVYSNYVRYHLAKFWRMQLRLFLQAAKDSPGFSLIVYIIWSILWWSLSSIHDKICFCHLDDWMPHFAMQRIKDFFKWQKYFLLYIEDKDHHKMDQSM